MTEAIKLGMIDGCIILTVYEQQNLSDDRTEAKI